MKKNQHKTSSPKEKPDHIPVSSPAFKEEVTGKYTLTEDSLKKIFIFSLVGMLFITLFCGYNVGFNSDEIEMNNYGKANLAYYLSAGKDTTLKQDYYKLLVYYGNGYELIASTVNKVLHTDKGTNEFNVRHIINQLMAIAGLLFTGLTARKFTKSWTSSIFAIWLLFLTPSFMGHFLFNTRDIPFYAGYIATTYFIISFLEELPAPTWKTSICLMLAFSFTTNIRIGGFLLLLYFGLFTVVYLAANKELLAATLKNAANILIKTAVILVGGITLIILTWPFMLKRPSALFEALGIASKFPMKVNINFEGNAIDSLNVPVYYIPKYMLVTIPIFVIICIISGFIIFLLNIKRDNWKIGSLLLFTILFPVIYAISTNAALYSSWRHFLFIFPGMCIFGAYGLQKAFTLSLKLPFKIALGAFCLILMIKPIAFCMRNTQYEYCYFNEVAGNFKGAFYTYDNDYWEITMKNALVKLIEDEHLANRKDTVTLATNALDFTQYYIKRHYPQAKIAVVPSGVSVRNCLNWNYAVYNSLFLKPDYLENYYPPPNVYFSENIDGMPVTIVLKDTIRLDIQATNALRASQSKLADSLFSAYIKTTKDDNPGLYGLISIAKASIMQNAEAIKLADKSLRYHLSPLVDYNCYCGLGIAYANTGKFAQSIDNLKRAQKLLPKETSANDLLRQVYDLQRRMGPPH